MSGRTLFLSDVHLGPGDTGRQERFVRFLAEAKEARRIYLLGDLFDYWISPRHAESDDYRTVLDGLRGLTADGLRVAFLPGNRDYLVDDRFAAATGVELVGDAADVGLGGRRVFVTHGDLLYNKNPKYAAYRRLMRFPAMQGLFQRIPSPIGKQIAKGYRKVSPLTTPEGEWTDAELIEGAERHFQRGIDVVICGHIHRPCHLTKEGCELFILGDWNAGGEYVEHDGSSFTLRKLGD
ncbi:MAG: UDP-2,3-diacylglucosamine diphosphatase [Planctomycetota bacterium]|jgi:UDP-2,3-diacylglucosamine hydrolase